MRFHRAMRARLRGILQSKQADAELDEEMAFHLEMETARNERAGMSPAEARRRAVLAFGGTERHKEQHRDGRSLGWIEDLVRDLRYGIRGFVRVPLFALTAILTLGIAIGAGAIVFSMVNGMLLRPFPAPDPGALVALWGDERGEGVVHLGYEDYRDWRAQSGIFTDLAAMRTAPVSLGTAGGGDGVADLLWSEIVTPNYFAVLGLTPAAGRFFTESETQRGSEPRVVVSHDYWMTQLGGEPEAIGRSVLVNGVPGVVVGVAPGSFHGARRFGFWPDVWIALGVQGTEGMLHGRGEGALISIGRLGPGMTRERAQAAATSFAGRLAESHPATNRDLGALLTSARAPFDNPRFVEPRILTLASAVALVAVGLLLIVGCANVASLMLARASARQREIAIRLAIGGSRSRLIRQLLAESSLLAAGGGLLGLAVGLAAPRIAAAIGPQLQFKAGIDASLDHRVLLFTASIALASVFLFGLMPAWQTTRAELMTGLKGEPAGARRGRRLPELREVLVVGQLAFSVVLLVAGVLFVRSLAAVRTVDLGLETDGRVMVTVNPGLSGYDGAGARRFYGELQQRVAALPGVQSASLGFPVPFDTNDRGLELFVDGVTNVDARQTFGVSMSIAESDFFRTLGTPMLDGRDFAPYDTAGAPLVMIVNRSFATRFWPGASAVGRRARVGGPDGRELHVIGVAGDAVYRTPTQQPPPMVFLPAGQQAALELTLVAHTHAAAAAAIAGIESIVRGIDPAVAAYGATTMQRAKGNALKPQQSAAMIATVVGALALVLAVVGLYGVVAYSVDRRKREVGIRMALGASRRAVLTMILRRAASTALIGLGIGLGLALLTGQLMASLLFQVQPHDPVVLGVVTATLAFVVLLASWVPARRAARVDPLIVLRSD